MAKLTVDEFNAIAARLRGAWTANPLIQQILDDALRLLEHAEAAETERQQMCHQGKHLRFTLEWVQDETAPAEHRIVNPDLIHQTVTRELALMDWGLFAVGDG